jgi:predicted phosphodiesterase
VLNPGSATGADPADTATMMTVEAGDGDIDVTVHEA